MAEPHNIVSDARWRRGVAYIGAGIAAFAIFLIATYPYSGTISDALAPAGLTLTSAGQHLSLPFGAELDDARLAPLSNPSVPLLESEHFEVTPSWGALLRRGSDVNVRAELMGGMLSATVRRTGDATLATFALKSIDLAKARDLSPNGARVTGLLAGAGELDLSSMDRASQSGTVALRVTGVQLTLGAAAPPINLGEVSAKLKLTGMNLTLEELASSGGDLTLDGRGAIWPALDWRMSPINLTVKIEFSPASQGHLQFVAAMLPHPPGAEPYRVVGTLGAPIFVGFPPSIKTTNSAGPSVKRFDSADSGRGFRKWNGETLYELLKDRPRFFDTPRGLPTNPGFLRPLRGLPGYPMPNTAGPAPSLTSPPPSEPQSGTEAGKTMPETSPDEGDAPSGDDNDD